ncbi:MAG TPA: hypothetical protein VFI25_18500 [Planctomycetota bacterium]|jgi:hypothetical protein|nr:hypothetical protein [Planctomycetota bacterium]
MVARNRGAAYVGVIWFVFALILLFGALAGVAIQASQAGEVEEGKKRAEEEARKAEEKRDELDRQLVTLAGVVGFQEPDSAVLYPRVEAAKEALENLRSAFPTITAEVKTLRDSLPRILEAYRARGEKIANLETDARRFQSEVKAAQDGLASTTRQKDEEIQRLRKSLDDANAKTANQVAELDQRVQGLRQQNRELDQQAREARTASEKKEIELRRDIAAKQARIYEQGKKLEPIAKEPDRPDGRIVSVSETLPMAFVDIGAKHRLQRGVRFEVRDGARPARVKAWAEVAEVERDQAQVRVYDVADRFDPVVKGDLITNPLYDPNSEKFAVLLGRFAGRLNKPQVAMLLSDVGVKVQEKVDRTTDFVVLGAPEEAELTGEGKPLNETEEYRKAEEYGCQIVPLRRVEAFFKF